MKRSTIIIAFLCIGMQSFSQVNWVRNFDVAKMLAVSENKFIVMDFWAIWCGPCKKMDSDMWNTEQMSAYADKFIFLKVDVDKDRELAITYSANSIPKVILVDPTGEEVWEEVGFSSSSVYMNMFKDFPSEPVPGEHFGKIVQKEADGNTYFALGSWYQDVAKKMENIGLKRGVLSQSDKHFKECSKQAVTEALAIEAEFNLILNHAYRGAYKKAMKKVEKMEEDDMKNFIMAYCYKCEGQTDKMQEFMDKISSQELLTQLD